MKPFAVAILNWNGKDLLAQFLPDVIAHSKELATIYVIDNHSTDDSVAFVQEDYPDVKIIELAENYGYAGGYNKAMHQLDEELVVLLNSDIKTTKNWLAPIHQLFKDNEHLAACQPKIKDLKKPTYFEYAGAAGGFIDWLGYPFCRGRIFYEQEEDLGQYNDSREIFWATGAALVVRKNHYFNAGGLDESLFAHMEEIDLCWRMQLLDYNIMYCSTSTVYHLGGATLTVQNPKKTYLNFRNNMIIMAKNLPMIEFFAKVLIRLTLDGIAGIKFLADGQPKHTWQIVRAHFAFYSRLPKILANRKNQPKQKRLKTLHGVFKGTTIWQYFAKNNKKFSELPEKFS